MNQFDASDRPLEELRELDNAKLEAHFPSATTIKNRRYDQLMWFFEKLNRAREHPVLTFQYHQQLYQEEYPQMNIDNNLTENYIRPIAVGCKNYLFAGSHDVALKVP